MNKKFAAVLAATCVLGATTAFAANPFSDVTPSDWAYQAVAKLAAEGVIEGYPDGTFKGERNITRYEMAQMVAKAMAHQDQLDAEQQAQIDRLANEFANELNSLGVRVSNLEDRVGNVKVTGDARVRWQDQKVGGAKNDGVDMRGRLQFNAKVGEKTDAVARVTTGNFRIDNEGQDAGIGLDRLYVDHHFDGFHVTGGRYGETLGETGYWYDDNVDGVKLAYDKDNITAKVGYGNMRGVELKADSTWNEYRDLVAKRDAAKAKSQDALAHPDKYSAEEFTKAQTDYSKAVIAAAEYKEKHKEALADAKNEKVGHLETAYGELGYTAKNVHLKGSYLAPNGNTANLNNIDSVWGAGAALNASDKVKLSGDYFSVQGKNGRKDADFWVGRVDFGKTDLQKPGSFNLYADYVNAEDGSYLGGTGSLRSDSLLNNTKSWGVGAGVVVAENVLLEAFRSFDAKTQDDKDIDDLTKVQVSYKF